MFSIYILSLSLKFGKVRLYMLKVRKRKIVAVALVVIIAFCAVFTTVRLIMYSDGKLYKLQELLPTKPSSLKR